MIVCIVSRKFGILAIFIISLLLSCATSIDPVHENLAASRLDEDNQTTITEHSSPSIDNVVSDSNPETLPTENVPVIETDPPVLSTENPPTETLSSTATPFIANNQTTDDQQQQQQQQPASTPSTKKNLSSINSFEEWKQQQLHADLQKTGRTSSQNNVASEIPTTSSPKGTSSSNNVQQITSTTGLSKKGKLRKNFASASCGAKILAHNVEAQNTPSILSSSPDEYMLNPCNAKIWFVIELCESIRILNIEIANFELFSSVPKTFRVSASDRYPTKDWHRHHLGTFNASHNRTIQSFQAAASTTYLKYVKFELLDFHGHEHYCPLSVVRVHGSNVEDEIMTMEENTNLVESKRSINIRDETENDDDGDDDDDNVNVSNDQQVGGIIGSAILDLAKRVFRRSAARDTLSTTSLPTTSDNAIKPDCRRTGSNDSIVNDSIRSWRQSDMFKQCIAEFLMGLWSKFDTCALYLPQICFKLNHCCQCPLVRTNISNDMMKMNNNRQISTLNLYINPCGYYHVLTNQFVCKKEKSIEVNKNISTNVNTSITQALLAKDLILNKNDTGQIANETENLANNQSTSNHTNTTFDESQNQSVTNRSIDQHVSANIPDEPTPVLDAQIPPNTSNESSSQSLSNDAPPIDPDIFEPSIDTHGIDDASSSTSTTTPSSTAPNYNEALPPLISSPWLKGMLVNTKSLPELFKIIEKLNFNLTLSNRYLQELSQHYVKKLDETQQTTDLLLKASKSADEKFEYLEEQLLKLQENYNNVSSRLIVLEAWIPLIVTTILALLFWCILTSWRLSRIRRKVKLLTEEFVKLQTVEKTEDDDDDEEEEDEEDPPVVCNGTNKRKLSSDSSESLPGRSQRVPDVCLSQIKENGIEKENHERQSKSSDPTRHLLPLSTI